MKAIYQQDSAPIGLHVETTNLPDENDAVSRPEITMYFTNLVTGNEMRRLTPDTDVCRAYADQGELRISPDATEFGIRTDRKRKLSLFSAETGAKIRDLDASGEIIGQQWSFVGSHAVVAPLGWKGVFWDLRTGRIALTLIPNLLPKDEVEHKKPQWIAYTPDGFYTGSVDCLAHFGKDKVRERSPARVAASLRKLVGPKGNG